jgi:molybdenum cofactor synthesis domain-containing protein
VAPKVRPEREGPFHVELIAVGDDLVRGHAADRNSPALAGWLAERGAFVRRITVVDRGKSEIRDAVRQALGRNPHLLVVSGGLGPAKNDRTLAAVAAALERPMTASPGARSLVEAAYARLRHARVVQSASMTAAREKMCAAPIGADLVPNDRGLAFGAVCRLPGGAAVVCLPGTPVENRSVFEAALPLLKDLLPRLVTARREIESPTADESELWTYIEALAEEFPDVRITSRPPAAFRKGSAAVLVVETTAPSAEEANGAIGMVQRKLLAMAGGGA